MGWALVKSGDYARPVRRLALRWRKRNGQRCHALLISSLEPGEVLRLVGELSEKEADGQAVLSAYARLYDERGGGVEIGADPLARPIPRSTLPSVTASADRGLQRRVTADASPSPTMARCG